MQLSGWGRYPRAEAEVLAPLDEASLLACLDAGAGRKGRQAPLIARGLGRSYGDSALGPRVLSTAHLDHLLHFDEATGRLRCSAGARLDDILQVCVPKGWFLPVTPGTKFVTLGGAIASDVHGKNHHLDGSFADQLLGMKIATLAEGVVEASPQQRPELFRATCGGMGLTGMVLEASFQLKPLPSAQMQETTLIAANLEEALALFEEHQQSPYSVAWVDCLAKGRALGRALVTLGAHAEEGGLAVHSPPKFSLPVDLPASLLNSWTVRAFNALYYRRPRLRAAKRLVHYEPYFYPLDAIGEWNRLYGRRGFVQYQFVLPKAASLAGMGAVLGRIAASGRASFLTVLKLFGKGNGNYLSFPMAGYTLALDFKMARGLLPFLDELDRVVLDHGGRVYLAKDARMSAATLRQGYPDWQKFMAVRAQYGGDRLFHSLQSQRLGL